jgi:extracellular factor (EF) 3-hydroxypalmitic acid methyl ester biosynthesis protein
MHGDIKSLLDRLQQVEDNGGPSPEQYGEVVELFDAIAALRLDETSADSILDFRNRAPSFSSTQTMHGFVCVRPHGYAGDFEIIDRIYRQHVAEDSGHAAWDHFFHAGDAALAVRARKAYCVALFSQHAKRVGKNGAEILDVASGPCRDVLEFKLLASTEAKLARVHCIDMDPHAIAFSQDLLSDFADTVTFENRNILRSKIQPKYDLIWSAGLFDYFDDRVFTSLLKRLYGGLRQGGELVVGNFSPILNSRSYMEFGDWRLHYRNEALLIHLAEDAGFKREQIHVGREETGVNLFLHISRR